ncbi:MAG: TolC family protein [Rhodothermales bacterium]|nr:TolC family protein [Rhodothermales bacterium]
MTLLREPVQLLTGTKFFSLSLLVAALLLTANSAVAQQQIDFEDAVDIALDRNVALKKSANAVILSESAVKQAKADFLPNLNVNSSASRNWGLSFDQTAGKLVNAVSDGLSGSVSSGVNVFNGFSDVAGLNQAKLLLEADEYSLARAEQGVYFNVVSNYLQVLLDQEQVAIRLEDLESQRQQLTRIEEFTRLGARPISDLYQQQATAAQSEFSLLESERAVELSKVALIQVLQLDPFVDYAFDAPRAEELNLEIMTYELDAILRMALEKRADLLSLQRSLDAAAEGIRIAKSSRYPSVNLSGSYGSSYSSSRDEDLSSQFSDNRSGSARLSLSVPIFNRMSTRNNIQRSEINYNNQMLDLQNFEQSILLEVRREYLAYQSLAKQLDVTEIQLNAATQAEQVEQERYNVGASTLVELTQARAALVSAASNRAQVIYRFIFQSKLIDYYIGVLNPSDSVFN